MEIAGPHPLNMPENELDLLEIFLNTLAHHVEILAADPEISPELWDFFDEIVMLAVRMYVVGNEPFTHDGVAVVEELNWALTQRYAILLELAFF
ncbi:Protein CBG22687 [Caenorhabditis briggsae]|uniref:Protein CBG22687 n=1 Tax=Caenorhabditis briggsae TaxID=6238 RepID=A8Y2Y4_CAEBR|nr:Protein CBG22687 [Caenorhabditis briggsae]CAP39225.1 Protein CBG22687 [Caenorhabditis briggsae]